MSQGELLLGAAEQGYRVVAGVDEVGRGPLAGDVVAAAVILDPAHPIVGLADSKQLSERKREQLYPLIIAIGMLLAASLLLASAFEMVSPWTMAIGLFILILGVFGIALEPPG